MIPPSYQRMVLLVGVPNFLFLCAEWSGGGKYLPTYRYIMRKGENAVSIRSVPERDRAAVTRIGIRKYLDLLEAFGGRHIYLPDPSVIVRPVRDRRIQAAYSGGGMSVEAIARTYGVTRSAVHKICKGLPRGGEK